MSVHVILRAPAPAPGARVLDQQRHRPSGLEQLLLDKNGVIGLRQEVVSFVTSNHL